MGLIQFPSGVPVGLSWGIGVKHGTPASEHVGRGAVGVAYGSCPPSTEAISADIKNQTPMIIIDITTITFFIMSVSFDEHVRIAELGNLR